MAESKSEKEYIRRGNKFYTDSLYEKAEIQYRKALDLNPQSVDAMYNLGNVLFQQQKGKEAIEQYAAASTIETDKNKLAAIYHNMGTLFYVTQQYPQSIEAYKNALRNNPQDNETRYNLAMAQFMNKNKQQDQQQEQNQEKQDQEQQQQQEQQNQEEQKQEENEQQQQQQQEQQAQEQNAQEAQASDEDISKENAEQMLEALMQDEKDLQEKMKVMIQQQQGKSLDKDW